MQKVITVKTLKRCEFIDITERVKSIVIQSDTQNRIIHIYIHGILPE